MRIPLFRYLFLAFPFLEIAGFIIVGDMIGLLPTIALIIATSVLGLLLLRRQGFKALEQMYQQRQTGPTLVNEMVEGPFVVIAGFLLLLPGFITDLLGLLLLLPWVRTAILGWMQRKGMVPPERNESAAQSHRTLEGEYWHDEDDNNKDD